MQPLVLTCTPLTKQHTGSICAQKVGSDGTFKGPPEKHGGPRIFFLPAIEITMSIAPRAGQILADLRVAVSHHVTCKPSILVGESSSQRPAEAKPSNRSKEVPLRTT